MVVALCVLGLRGDRYDIALQVAAFSPLLAGMALIYLGTYRFSSGDNRLAPTLWLGATAIGTMNLAFVLGFSGPATILLNLWCALFLGLSGGHYWRARQEAPLPMIASVILLALTSLSFLACAAMLLLDGSLQLPGPPSSWAEQFNSIMAIVGLTGLGALALTLNQSRVTRRHRHDAETDALTGQMNRRALFERFDRGPLAAPTAVLMFDIDHFKQINDLQGHGVGDAVIRHFAMILDRGVRQHDVTARIGGEEFCAVLPNLSLDDARRLAERIRQDFQQHPLWLTAQYFPATVSAGVATGDSGEAFSSTLHRADAALYAAKRGGRNRVTSDAPRQAA